MANIEKLQLLIVGGQGFIGKHLALLAHQNNFAVTVITRNLPISEESEIYEILVCDICDKAKLSKLIKNRQFDYVINCAGDIDHSSFLKNGRRLIDQHFVGVLNLAELLSKDKLKLFVQLGSSDEYGANSAPQIENQRELPISPYSLAKTAATQFLQMLYHSEKFPAVIYRLFLVYGPGQSMNRLMPQVIDACLNDIEFPTSTGEQLRDFVYIDDVCSTILDSLNNKKITGKAINLASGQGVTIKSIIEKIQKLTNGGKPVYGEIPYREGENMALYANIEKAKTLLNWSPKVSLDEGLVKTIEYYKDQTR